MLTAAFMNLEDIITLEVLFIFAALLYISYMVTVIFLKMRK